MATDSHPTALSEFPFVISLPVLWDDQDAFGRVNNALSVRWLGNRLLTGRVGPTLDWFAPVFFASQPRAIEPTVTNVFLQLKQPPRHIGWHCHSRTGVRSGTERNTAAP